jgi:signal transduction histidine kinase
MQRKRQEDQEQTVMIKPTKRKLIIRFAIIIIVFNALILALSFFTLNDGLIKSLKNHINNDVADEFLPHVKSGDFATLESIREHEHFQVYNRDGQAVTGTYNFSVFYLPLNKEMLAKAFSGEQNFERIRHNGESYLVSYVRIDDRYAGRVSMPLTALIGYEQNFIVMIVICLPLMLIVSFLVSWLLVKQAMKPIEEVFTFQGNFSSNVTHEMKTPLASLKGNLEVALRKDRSSEEYKEILQLGLRDVDRIIGMLNNLYLLASSEFQPLEMLTQKANIRLIVEETIEFYRPRMEARNITLESSLTDVANLICDSDLMRRAVVNLVDNAVKYTPEGGKIRIELTMMDHKLNLIISNTCDPLSLDDSKHIFEPFYRGGNALSCSIEGKGLGLYIARYIVRSHGGDISIKATGDNVCTITLYCPKK